jgi:hypothetical protein
MHEINNEQRKKNPFALLEPPKKKYHSSIQDTLKDFSYCKSLAELNPTFPFSYQEPGR